MIDATTAIIRLTLPTDPQGPPETALLFGALPTGVAMADLIAACGEKPTIRKLGGVMAIVLPVAGGRWVAWLFDKIAPVTALPALVEKTGALTLAFLAEPAQPVAPGAGRGAAKDGAQSASDVLLPRLAMAQRRDAATVFQLIADAMVETGLARAVAVGRLRGGRFRLQALSDQRLYRFTDEITLLATSRRDTAQPMAAILASDLGDDGLDAALLAEMTGDQGLALDLAPGGNGLGFVLFGPQPGADGTICTQIRDLADIVLRQRPPVRGRRRMVRAGAMVAGLAMCLWLALPAPLLITATVVAEPRDALALAVPTGAYVEDIRVRVGDRVAKGDVVAQLRAPDLEEQRLTAALDIKVDQVAAQAALSENNYGAYVLAEQKTEAARQRLATLENHIAALTIVAPDSGRIVSAIGADVRGGFLRLGETVAVVHPAAKFTAVATVSRVDAPLLAAGQTGTVWFRGIPRATWALTTETPVSQIRNPANGAESLILRARLTDADQNALFAGLAGYAKIEVGQAMRASIYSRYVTAYLRTKAWIWFDLRF